MTTANFNVTPTTAWRVYSEKTFGVEVVAWSTIVDVNFLTGKPTYGWNWNVYAHIFEEHPIYDDVEAILSLPFHGGFSYDEKFTRTPLRGIQYDFQQEINYIKVGSDYAHYGDEHFRECLPSDGVPLSIQYDVHALVAALQNYKGIDNDEEGISSIA